MLRKNGNFKIGHPATFDRFGVSTGNFAAKLRIPSLYGGYSARLSACRNSRPAIVSRGAAPHFSHYRAMIARAKGAILLTISGVNAKSVRGSVGASKFRAILDLRCRPPCRGIGGDPWRKPRIRFASGDMAMPASHVMKRDASTNQAMRHQAVRRRSWPALECVVTGGMRIARKIVACRVAGDAARGARVRRRPGPAVRGAGSCRRWSSAVRCGIRRISAACIRSGSRVREP